MAYGKAATAKDKGNAAFKSGDFPTAIGHYTDAIFADRNDHTFPLNRAAAYLKLGKNEDAERDCSTVLALSAFNAKALFRRGQARTGMGRLDEARQDFAESLKREPTNETVKAELAKLDQLAEQKLKSHPASPSPKRRRVPIKIIHPNAASTVPASSPLTPKVTEEPHGLGSENDTLKPVSSRSLKPSLAPSSSTSTEKLSLIPALLEPKSEQPRTFSEAKSARDSIKPSRVGGGIFRASGDSTIFPTRGGSATGSESKLAPTPTLVPDLGIATPTRASPPRPPLSLYDFSRSWDSLSTTEERWSLFSTIPPLSLPAFFKTSLEPALLVSILEVFREVVHATEKKGVVREYMDHFVRVPRFETVVLFMSRDEKEVARNVWESLGVSKGDLGKQWGAVW